MSFNFENFKFQRWISKFQSLTFRKSNFEPSTFQYWNPEIQIFKSLKVKVWNVYIESLRVQKSQLHTWKSIFETWNLNFETLKSKFSNLDIPSLKLQSPNFLSFIFTRLKLLEEFQSLDLDMSTFKVKNFELWHLELLDFVTSILKFNTSNFDD